MTCNGGHGRRMRISDHRYSRDLRRHDLALRMIRHEVRTITIRSWTGLSDTRIRALVRSYVSRNSVAAVARHRGPPPSRLAPILKSTKLAGEAAGLAGLCWELGVVPAKPLAEPERDLPSVGTGERLCYAFELYQQIVPKPQMTLDLLILLVTELARRTEVALGHCARCDAALLVDLLQLRARLCDACERGPAVPMQDVIAALGTDPKSSDESPEGDPNEAYQRPLFE
jgi:hypothetical protein